MSWHSMTYALTIPAERIALGLRPRELFEGTSEPDGDPDDTIFTSSRNGVLLWTLGKIVDCASFGRDLYLLQDEALLAGAELQRQHDLIAALFAEILRDPQCVLDATRSRHEPRGTIHAAGFEPLGYEMVYPSDSVIEDGWVYFYTKDQVRSLVAAAHARPDALLEDDHEGETLDYLFGFLRLHASLLQLAISLGRGVAYAEVNPRD